MPISTSPICASSWRVSSACERAPDACVPARADVAVHRRAHRHRFGRAGSARLGRGVERAAGDARRNRRHSGALRHGVAPGPGRIASRCRPAVSPSCGRFAGASSRATGSPPFASLTAAICDGRWVGERASASEGCGGNSDGPGPRGEAGWTLISRGWTDSFGWTSARAARCSSHRRIPRVSCAPCSSREVRSVRLLLTAGLFRVAS